MLQQGADETANRRVIVCDEKTGHAILSPRSNAPINTGVPVYYRLAQLRSYKQLRRTAQFGSGGQWVRIRTGIQNALAGDGQRTIASLPLAPHTAYRRNELQAMYVKFEAEIEKLNQRVKEQACGRAGARLLMTHPGVGPVTALATEVFLGDPARFTDGKRVASYVGIIPSEYSSGGRQRLGGLSKQGNALLRFLWGEAAAHAVRRDPELQRFYRRKLVQKGLGKARMAVARKLGIRMWIMLRDQIEYNEFCRRGQMQQKSGYACAGMPETP